MDKGEIKIIVSETEKVTCGLKLIVSRVAAGAERNFVPVHVKAQIAVVRRTSQSLKSHFFVELS